MQEHLCIVYRLPDGRLVTHHFHYLSTDADGMTTWQIDPANEEIDLCKAQFVKMDWEENNAKI